MECDCLCHIGYVQCWCKCENPNKPEIVEVEN